MTTEVIILAQGVQSRLPELAIPKQWLPLPACAETPILARTVVQLGRLMETDDSIVTVVCWDNLRALIQKRPLYVNTYSLIDPGNSSLKGIKTYLEAMGVDYYGEAAPPFDRTVVLLGDVVYSWACLEELLFPDGPAVRVCKSSDLSPSGGELWGVAWPRMYADLVEQDLDEALKKHPPFSEYQPGQLRRWYWQMRDHSTVPVMGVNIDDYTDDVDVPADVKNLPIAAAAAAADDLKRGITWPL